MTSFALLFYNPFSAALTIGVFDDAGTQGQSRSRRP
jgi:hypothetical protein